MNVVCLIFTWGKTWHPIQILYLFGIARKSSDKLSGDVTAMVLVLLGGGALHCRCR